MSFKPIFFILGVLMTVLAATMLLPFLIDLATHNSDWKAFAASIGITAFTGISLILTTRSPKLSINTKQAFLLTTLSWVVIAAFGAIPFCLSDLKMSYTDAFFESMSGITTTGSTVITGLDTTPPGILFWRAMLQWLGGVGILIMALSVLPMLRVGGMQLFKAESLEVEKVMPSAAQIATNIGIIYCILTLIWAVLYALAGMTVFEAFSHSMTTIATGGFSTSDQSMRYFNSAVIDYICVSGMIVGGLPFVYYLRSLRGDPGVILRDSQVRWFLVILSIAILITTSHLLLTQEIAVADAFRHASFNITSIITGTGYATQDYNAWGPLIMSLVFFLMCVGGCAGSTTCGIKIFRFQVLYAVSKTQMQKLLNPNGVFQPYYNGKPMSPEIPTSVMAFFFLFALCFSVIALLLQFIGLDFVTAMSGAVTAISNVGPALGDIIGPTGTFQPLPDSAKWVLAFGMLIGRLEIFTLLIILSPQFWRD